MSMNSVVSPSSPLSVMHVVSGDLYAGAERIVEELAIAQHAHLKLRVGCIVLNEGQLASNLVRAGLPTYVLDERRLGVAALLRRMRGLVRDHRAQIVHTHRFKENVLGALAAVGRAPSLRTVHGAPEFSRSSLRGWVIDALDRFAANGLQRRVVAVSDELAGRLRHVYGVRSLSTVPNGIDPDRVIRASTDTVPELPGGIRIGVFARLVPVKRVDLAIEVARRARERLGADVVLHVFGDGALEATLREQARGLQGVHFHGNTLQAPAYMRQMHALLLTSSHEGLPVCVLEAMSLSVPVVATRIGGIPHALAEGECGWLADASNPDAYVEAVVQAVTPGELRARKISGAVARVRQELSAARMAQAYLRIYEELLAGSHRPAEAAST